MFKDNRVVESGKQIYYNINTFDFLRHASAVRRGTSKRFDDVSSYDDVGGHYIAKGQAAK